MVRGFLKIAALVSVAIWTLVGAAVAAPGANQVILSPLVLGQVTAGTPSVTIATGNMSNVQASALPTLNLPTVMSPDYLERAVPRRQPSKAARHPSAAIFPVMSSDSASTPLANAKTGEIFFAGEDTTRTFKTYIADPKTIGALDIAYQTSIDVLPEKSNLSVSVNGVSVGSARPEAFGTFETLHMTVPASVLRPGENIVKVHFRLFHRIYCGVEASYQLWASVKVSESGFVDAADVVQAGSPARFLDGLLALAAVNGDLAIKTATPNEPVTLNLKARLMDFISGLTHGRVVQGRFVNPYAVRSGEVPPARVSLIQAATPGFQFRVAADGANVLVIQYVPGADVNFGDLMLRLPKIDFGTRASVPAMPSDKWVTLQSLGYADRKAQGHFTRLDYRFALPDHWLDLTGETAKVLVDLRASGAISDKSRVTMWVNGHAFGTVKVAQKNTPQGPAKIEFPLALMHPGVNNIAFVATLRAPQPKLPCVTPSLPQLQILRTTKIFVPRAPRMYFTGIEQGSPQLTSVDVGTDIPRAERDAITRIFNATIAADALHSASAPAGGRLHVITAVDALSAQVSGADSAWITDVANALTRSDNAKQGAIASAAAATQTSSGLLSIVNENLRALVTSGSQPDLQSWLANRTIKAAVVNAPGARNNDLWLIVGNSADPLAAMHSFVHALARSDSPRGDVAVLAADNQWRSWRSNTAVPRIANGNTSADYLHVIGNYLSWFPVLFVVGVLALAWLIAGLLYVASRRRHNRGKK